MTVNRFPDYDHFPVRWLLGVDQREEQLGPTATDWPADLPESEKSGPWSCPAHGCTRPLEAHPVEQATRNKPPAPQTKDENQ